MNPRRNLKLRNAASLNFKGRRRIQGQSLETGQPELLRSNPALELTPVVWDHSLRLAKRVVW